MHFYSFMLKNSMGGCNNNNNNAYESDQFEFSVKWGKGVGLADATHERFQNLHISFQIHKLNGSSLILLGETHTHIFGVFLKWYLVPAHFEAHKSLDIEVV